MDNKAIDQDYSLDRKTASRLLRVSIRTVDRYIKSKKLSTNVVDGRIWLSKKEINGFKLENRGYGGKEIVDMSTSYVSTDRSVDEVDNIEVMDSQNGESVTTRKGAGLTAKSVYKKLYADLKEELKEKQERLEIANYRVGQLEAQVKNSIPMLEYHTECYENKKAENELQLQVEEQALQIKAVASKLRQEKFNKRIFLIILLFILSLQPLWILFVYNN